MGINMPKRDNVLFEEIMSRLGHYGGILIKINDGMNHLNEQKNILCKRRILSLAWMVHELAVIVHRLRPKICHYT